MKHVIELKALEMRSKLYVRMNVYKDDDLVPRWSTFFPLYRATTEYIMNIYYEYYLYVPLLACSQSILDDCKRQMSRWLANYKRRHSIEGIANWKYELEF